MNKSFKLLMPMMPNFLRVEIPTNNDLPSIDVADLSPTELDSFIKEWSETFRQHVEKRRKLNASQKI